MTQEEKELLLKDLCARLPYCTRCTYPNDIGLHIPVTEINIHDDGLVGIHGRIYNLYEIKPYLRPMSSMTEEEWEHLGQISLRTNIYDDKKFNAQSVKGLDIDYLNSIYVDYRGLIPMGLALEAPEDMYKNK